jgi:hypothetical protein
VPGAASIVMGALAVPETFEAVPAPVPVPTRSDPGWLSTWITFPVVVSARATVGAAPTAPMMSAAKAAIRRVRTDSPP